MKTVLRDEGGSVLMIAVIAMLILGVLSVSFALLSTIESRIGFNHKQQAQAEALAEAGLQRAFDGVRGTTSNFSAAIATGLVTFSSPGPDLGAGTYHARLDNNCAPLVPAAFQDPNCGASPGTDGDQTAVVTAWAEAKDGAGTVIGRARVRALATITSLWEHVCVSAPTSGGYCTDSAHGNPNVVPADPNDAHGPEKLDDLPRPWLGCSRIDPLLHRGSISMASQIAGCIGSYPTPKPYVSGTGYPTAPTAAPRTVIMGDATGPYCNADPKPGSTVKYYGYFDCGLTTYCDPVAGDVCPGGTLRRGCLLATDSRVTPTDLAYYDPVHYLAGGPGLCTVGNQGMVLLGNTGVSATGSRAKPMTVYDFNTGGPGSLTMTVQAVFVYGTLVVEGNLEVKNPDFCTGGPAPGPASNTTSPLSICGNVTVTAYGYPLAILMYEPTLPPPVPGTPQTITLDHGTSNTYINGYVYTSGTASLNPVHLNGGIVAFAFTLQGTSSDYIYQRLYGDAAPPPGFPSSNVTVGYHKTFIVCADYHDESSGATACQ
ncbi:MAG: hypothetical protein DMD79_24800 [Candidatus Rokuibacteriota bacterium]|nr:MAG: hypothetical protein DMD79_24800 [Candidatus Rokubacteria bacterium]